MTKLVSITQPVVDGIKTAEELVVYCARVSNPNNQLNTETGPRLIKYLITHKHWSPFEQVSMCVELETSRAISAQILRHRSFVFQEFSQRYADHSGDFVVRDARTQGDKKRQSSEQVADYNIVARFRELQLEVQSYCTRKYREALQLNVAREQARFLLPLSAKTTIYMSGTLRSWIHYLEIRTSPETQQEHREVAEAIKAIFTQQFPVISEALGWTNPTQNQTTTPQSGISSSPICSPVTKLDSCATTPGSSPSTDVIASETFTRNSLTPQFTFDNKSTKETVNNEQDDTPSPNYQCIAPIGFGKPPV